jgi:aliphatic nitrilase
MTGTMFNSQVYIAPDGTLIGKHQKIMPTVGERLVHMGGMATPSAPSRPTSAR